MFAILYWGIVTSLKTKLDLRYNFVGLPDIWYKPWTWEWKNYITAFKSLYVPIKTADGTANVYLLRLIVNSLIYCVSCAVVGQIVPCCTAYATSRFKDFRLSKILVSIVYITMVIPIFGTLPSQLQIAKDLGLYGSLWGHLIRTAGYSGVSFLVYRAAFLKVPQDFREAAQIDGAGEFFIMFVIMIPLVIGTFFTFALLSFVGCWGDYMTPLIWIPNMPTLAYGLYKFSTSTTNTINNIPSRITGCVIALIPVLVIFSVASSKFTMNLTMGGVKE